MANANEFKFPDHYSLPPFFTIQPVATTRAKQLEMWTALVAAYVRHTQRSTFIVADACRAAPFANAAIDRRLPVAGVRLVLDAMCSAGYGVWTDGAAKGVCALSWRRADEWAASLHQWAVTAGQQGAMCTVYELRAGDATRGQEFHGLDADVLVRALRVLREQNKAALIESDGEPLDEMGVKFL